MLHLIFILYIINITIRRSVRQSTYQMRGVKTGRRRKIPVNDNKNETTELDGTYNEREIIEGR